MSHGITGPAPRRFPLRLVGWGLLAALLALPAVAMLFTDEVDWDETDFIVMGIMLGTVGGLCELAGYLSKDWTYRIGALVAAVAGFLLVWINLAVGIIGNEDEPANAMFLAVLGTALFGALAVMFRPRGLAWVMLATAVVQVAVAVIGLTVYPGVGAYPWWPQPLIVLTAFFTGAWLVAAWLFHQAARAVPGTVRG